MPFRSIRAFNVRFTYPSRFELFIGQFWQLSKKFLFRLKQDQVRSVLRFVAASRNSHGILSGYIYPNFIRL